MINVFESATTITVTVQLIVSKVNQPMIGKYKIITLCGSTRFKDAFLRAQKRLTLEGNIVISVGLFGHSGDNEVWTEGTKKMLDDMHLRKSISRTRCMSSMSAGISDPARRRRSRMRKEPESRCVIWKHEE